MLEKLRNFENKILKKQFFSGTRFTSMLPTVRDFLYLSTRGLALGGSSMSSTFVSISSALPPVTAGRLALCVLLWTLGTNGSH